ncbi:MAG: transcriptional regulator [Flavobacterium sp.]|uniref:transcriptional regulator n=1 Tax=Flavobacterium sp. TaxID=239 RepID=UPI000C4F130C|nr:transcriptional regulator [Flavobacterium sp.]MBF04640.1 transcriptional regulator [Flavobacterium sp.]
MNYIKHLTGFFEKVAIDKSLNPTHVSLYIALFQFWNCNRFKNPISISRDEVMRISKISSKATYHKCLKNLHSLGYINYEPSYNPFKGSHVYLFNFSDDLKPIQKNERKPKNEPLNKPVSEQALNKSCTRDETSSEQALVPSINYINNTNNLNIENVSNLNEQAKNFQESNNDFVILTIGEITSQEKKLREKKKGFIQPNLQEVKSYFQEHNFPEIEAQKFFNYFSSNGWLVGGKTPMVDWQAAAQNWMINAPKFISNAEQPNRAKQLNTTTDKDYSEPL